VCTRWCVFSSTAAVTWGRSARGPEVLMKKQKKNKKILTFCFIQKKYPP
jgi:hypothetical protein